MAVTTPPTASVSIAASPVGSICAATSVTFTATPTNGGTTPAYQWNKNGIAVGTNSATYTNASWANGDIITCAMTSNLACVTGSPATSAGITMTVNPTTTASVSIAANPIGPVCATSSVTFTATPTNGGITPAYQWKKNGSNVGTNSVTYTNSSWVNNDAITCVMTSNAACVTGNPATSSATTMSVNPASSTLITTGGATTFCNGGSVTLTSALAGSYSWNTGATTRAISPTTTGNFAVTINGCLHSDTVKTVVTYCTETINLKVIIQGFHLHGTDSMVAVVDPIGHPSVCDTISLSLVDSATLLTVATAKGTINTHGNGVFNYTGLLPGKRFYLVVKHRNSIQTWSKYSLLFTNPTLVYDFSKP
jgi:hypothetical protein